MTMKVDLPSSSLKIGITSFVPPSFSEPNTGVVRPHFHSSSNSVHCSRTPTCAGKDEKKHGHQFHSAKGILYLQCFYKLVKIFLAPIMWSIKVFIWSIVFVSVGRVSTRVLDWIWFSLKTRSQVASDNKKNIRTELLDPFFILFSNFPKDFKAMCCETIRPNS